MWGTPPVPEWFPRRDRRQMPRLRGRVERRGSGARPGRVCWKGILPRPHKLLYFGGGFRQRRLRPRDAAVRAQSPQKPGPSASMDAVIRILFQHAEQKRFQRPGQVRPRLTQPHRCPRLISKINSMVDFPWKGRSPVSISCRTMAREKYRCGDPPHGSWIVRATHKPRCQ